jgi:hypothetical protein
MVGGAAADEKNPIEEEEDRDEANWTALYHRRFNWTTDGDGKIWYLVPKRAGGKAFYLRQCEKGRKTSQLL